MHSSNIEGANQVNMEDSSLQNEGFSRINHSYHPDIWGDRFLNYAQEDDQRAEVIKKEVEMLKRNVEEELLAARCDSLQWLNYVNTLELLGVAYHFNSEIKQGFKYVYENYQGWDEEDDLYHISLRFRLLRQHGFRVPSDVFKKFSDEKGCFKESITSNVQGLLALYEASHVKMHGEGILDEALIFTTAHLRSMVTQLSYRLQVQVTRALKYPLHKFWSRLDHWHYISIFENDPSHNKTTLKFAKLDFNLIQSLHKKELSYLTSWWKGQELSKQRSFSRDRIVEYYYVYTATHFEPQYSELRIALTKTSVILGLIDDIYDGYGTLEELEIFTEAFDRWDRSYIHHLPDYMKPFYKTHLDIYEEVEQYLAKEGRENCIDYVRKTLKDIFRRYHQDAKWRRGKYHPTYDEYWMNAVSSIACRLLYVFCLIFKGDQIAPDEAFEWESQFPKPLKAHSALTRLLNDLSAASRRRDGTLSTIICYMKQFNVSEKQAIEDLLKQLDDIWKDLNQEMLHQTGAAAQTNIMANIVKLSRNFEIMYTDGGDPLDVVSQFHKDNIAKMFGEPFSV